MTAPSQRTRTTSTSSRLVSSFTCAHELFSPESHTTRPETASWLAWASSFGALQQAVGASANLTHAWHHLALYLPACAKLPACAAFLSKSICAFISGLSELCRQAYTELAPQFPVIPQTSYTACVLLLRPPVLCRQACPEGTVHPVLQQLQL
jgi:hypothetical protein